MAKSARAFVQPAEDAGEQSPKSAGFEGASAASEPTPAPVVSDAAGGAKPGPSYRVGRRNLSAWVDEKAFRQFKSMAAEEGKTIQDYVVEMMNREFARKGRPTIAK